MPPKKDDISLMLACQQGDDEAFDVLATRYSKKLIGFFYRLCWDAGTAEDLTQEVLIKLYKSRSRYHSRGSFTSYIYRIAHNVWIDSLRRKDTLSSAKFLEDLGGMAVFSSQISAEEAFEYKQKMEALKRAIDALTPEHRVVFVLYEQDVKYKDIAEILSIPEGTVKSRLHSTFCKLREAISRCVYL